MPSRRKDFGPNVFFMVLFSFVTFVVLLFFLIPFGESNGGNYLYTPIGRDEKASDCAPIIDYSIPDKMPLELNEDYEERKNNPQFLQEDEVNRVVEFYAPWCGHCIHFKPKYIKIARDVNEVIPLVFHAVSCQAHKEICRKQNIQGYPTVKWFPANSSVGQVINGRKISSEYILSEYLHVHKPVIDQIRNGASKSFLRQPKISQEGSLISKEVSKTTPNMDTFHVFHDASLSFYYTMRNSVFMTDNPLSEKQANALHSWLVILSKVLPVTMKEVKNDANVLLASFNNILKSEENMLKHIMEHNPSHRWTTNCSHGKDGAGYTCGLWQLFHIITVSTIEWNIKARQEDFISPTHVASAIRNFVEHFFACDECRTNFLKMYDECKYGLCNHLYVTVSKNDGEESWEWLPLWLWQAHNDVNIRLFHEEREDNGHPQTAPMEDKAHLWPSKNDCADCWLKKSDWNQEEVMKHLRKVYWSNEPYDIQIIHQGIASTLKGKYAYLNDNRISAYFTPKGAHMKIDSSNIKENGYRNRCIFLVTSIFFFLSLLMIHRLYKKRRREQKII